MTPENDLSSLGKTYRFFTAFFPVDKKRKGECVRCGICCQKANCKFLQFDHNLVKHTVLLENTDLYSVECIQGQEGNCSHNQLVVIGLVDSLEI